MLTKHITKKQPKQESAVYIFVYPLLELQKAFNLIKNQIGLGWKELTRALPNKPRKRLNQIDSEISAIEYKYPGQLGEQAYQV